MAGMRGKHVSKVAPEGKARLSQVVTTFGPGAMIDLLDHAVLVGGLEFWSYDQKKGVPLLDDARLRDAVAERLRLVGRDVSVVRPFRKPPPEEEKDPTRFRTIRVVELP